MSLAPTIMKFGGTSIEDAPAFERVVRIVRERHRVSPVVVVVSAISRFTDALLRSVRTAADGNIDAADLALEEHFERHRSIARALLGETVETFEATLERARGEIRELLESIATQAIPLEFLQDVVVSHGERLSANLLTAVFCENNLPAQYLDARRMIVTDDDHGRAMPFVEETDRRTRACLEPLIESRKIPVLGGFIAATKSGETTTLGRGGSDYSASLIGAALAAREIQIWTDVTGVLTADPQVVKTARTIPTLSYKEAAELAYFGAKVLHPKTIQPAIERSIPVRVCNSHRPEEAGTLIFSDIEISPSTVKAIVHKKGIITVQITAAPMLGSYGFLRAIFEIFERHRTVVDVVTTSEVSVSLSLDDATRLREVLHELRALGSVEVEERRAIICVIGEGLRSTPGIAGHVFSHISDINISLISLGASSVNLTFIVDEECVEEAVVRLHQAYFEHVPEKQSSRLSTAT